MFYFTSSRFEYCADATENDIDKADGIDTKVDFIFFLKPINIR